MDFAFTLPSKMRIFEFPSLPTASGCCCNLSSIAIIVVHPRIKATFACLGISPSFHHLLPIVSFCFLPLCHTIVNLFLKLASSRYCCQRLAASWCSPPGHLGRCELATRPANGRQRLASLSNCLRSGPLRAYLARVAACNARMFDMPLWSGGNARHKRIAASELGTKWRPNLLLLLLLLLLPVLLLLLFLQQQLLPLLLLLLTTN